MIHNELPCEDYCVDLPAGFEITQTGVPTGPHSIKSSGSGRFFEGATPVKVKLKNLNHEQELKQLLEIYPDGNFPHGY